MWFVAGGVAVAVFVLLALTAPAVFVAVVAAGIILYSLHRYGVWRTMVAASIVVSVLRSSTFATALPETVWYALQFGTLAAAAVTTLRTPRRDLRRSDRATLHALAVYVAAAALTALVSVAPTETISQAALFAAVGVFLTLTYTRRWVNADTIRADLGTVFATITLVQAAGIIAAFTGQLWTYDPDYGRYVGLFSNANYAGIMSAVGIAIGVYLLRVPGHRVLTLAGISVLTVGMLMSGSRGAILAVTAGLLVLLLARGSRRVVLGVLITAATAALIAIAVRPELLESVQRFFLRDAQADITSGRFLIYAQLLDRYQLSPWLGTGYRTSELADGGLAGHNAYLSVLTETGIVGAAVFAAFIICVLVASRNGHAHRPLLGVAVTVAVMELTESSVFGFGGPTALTAWLCVLAFAANGAHLNDEKNPLADPKAHKGVHYFATQPV